MYGGEVVIRKTVADGWDIHKTIDLDESEEEVKASAGVLGGLFMANEADAKRYLKIYNATAANVEVGTTVPDLTLLLPTQGDANGAGLVIDFGDRGLAFDTAITIAATTGIADGDSGAPGANEVVGVVWYK